ncbi:MAG TPA: methionyl-tRNA formyltransferase [Mycobacteriales bacterium]|nr:methionyl-tRNA formyltransferase [Mycobacteriales bacterium]
MRLVFAGTPSVAVPSLHAILDSGRHEVVAVVTRPDKPAGRGRTVRTSPIKDVAEERGIPVLQPLRAGDEDFLRTLRDLAPECCPVVAYGALLPRPALDIPTHGWVNLHFSLLPAWRGAAPVQHAILAGDEITGATTFLIEEGLDSGPVFGMLTAQIGDRETAGALLDRLAVDGAGLLLATLDGIADGSLQPRPQPVDGVTTAGKLTPDDARVDWSAPALRVDRVVRACTPAPGAWTTFRGKRLKLAPVDVVADAADVRPGALHLDGDGVLVGTGSSPVRLTDVQPEGRALMSADAWARGVRLSSGDGFE